MRAEDVHVPHVPQPGVGCSRQMAHIDTPTSSRARNRDQDEDEEDDPPYDQDELTGSQLGDAPPGTQTQVSRRAGNSFGY
jgi:hypothetical protein